MKILLAMLGFAIPALAFADANLPNSARVYEKDGHMIGEIRGGDLGSVYLNGNSMELKDGKLYVNGNVVYQVKGPILAELQVDPGESKLTVNGKPVPVPAAKESPPFRLELH